MKRCQSEEEDDVSTLSSMVFSIKELLTKIILSQFHKKEIYHTQQHMDLLQQRYVSKQFAKVIVDEVIKRIRYLSESVAHGYLPKEELVKFTGLREFKFKYDYGKDVKDIIDISHFTNLRKIDIRWIRTVNREYLNLSKLTGLESLSVPCFGTMTDNDVKTLISLTHLDLRSCKTFLGDVFQFLPLLTSLDLSGNQVVTEENILRIKNLRILDLTENRVVSDDTLSQLTSLTELMLCDNHLITDRGISGLSSLTQLSLIRGTIVSNRGLTCLHGLESLWIDKVNNAVSNMRGVSKLTTLKYLKTECIDIHNEVLLCLTNLTHLHIYESYIDIQPYVFEQLTRLTKLEYHVDSGNVSNSINQGLAKLHNLTHLDIRLCPCVTDDGIRHMTSLVKLFANGNITLDTYANFPNLRLLCSMSTDVVSPTHNLLTSLTYLESYYTVNPSPEYFEKFKSLKFIRLYQPLHQRHYYDSYETMEYFKKRYMSLNYECGSRFVETH